MSGIRAAIRTLFEPDPDEGSMMPLVKDDWTMDAEASLREICKRQRERIEELERQLAVAP